MRRFAVWWGGVGFVLVLGLGALAEGWGRRIGYRWVQAYVDWRMEKRLREAAQLLGHVGKGTYPAAPDYFILVYDQHGKLRSWNTNQWPLFTPTLSSSSPEIYADEEKAYYVLKQRLDSFTAVVAVPLWIGASTPFHEAYFLGRGIFPPVGLQASPLPEEDKLPLLYQDLSGQTVFRLYVGPWEAWLYPFRIAFLIGAGIWIIGIIVWLHIIWRGAKGTYGYLWRFSVVVVAIWGVWKALGLPGRYLQAPFFHAESLAWGWLVTSAWDLLVLGGVVLWGLWILPTRGYRYFWAFAVGYWVMWGIVGAVFWGLARHSQISLEPSDFERFGEFFLIGGLILGAVGRFLELWAVVYERQAWIGVSILLVTGIGIGIMVGLPWWSVLAMGLLYVLSFIVGWGPAFLRGAVHGILIVTVINGFFSAAQDWRAVQQAPTYAEISAFPRDPLLESRLQYRMAQLTQDSALWQDLSISDNLIDASFIARILRNYFLDVSENYVVVLSFWSDRNTRLDNQYEVTPLSWQDLPAQALTPTLSPRLFFVTKGEKRFFYTARYALRYQGYPFFLQIDLYPRSLPLVQLFVGETAPISYALYDNQQRVRVYGQGNFPFYGYRALQSRWSWQTLPDKYQLYYQVSTSRFLILEYPRRTFSKILASFPILLLIFAFLKGIEFVSRLSKEWHKLRSIRYRLAPRLQLVFIATIILPLLGLLSVSFFFFIRLREDSFKTLLSRKLSILHSYLQEERILSEKLSAGMESYIPHEESYIRDLMQRLSRLTESQVALYTANGFLYSTTLSPAYVGIYFSPLLDPSVRNSMEEGPVIRTYSYSFGAVTYGHIPLRSPTGRLLGYIQITSPASQASLYQAIEGFLAYGVNVYLFLILISTSVGILLIMSLLQGLSTLEAQVREAPPGVIPPRLNWPHAQDEIGTFVRAYNEMINRLEISQRELEMTLRQVSQQEMARQAAHEIKNALTPIKLIAQHLQRLPHVEPEKLHRLSHEMLQKIETLARIANRFLTFAGSNDTHTISLVPLHLNHFLEEYFQPYFQNTSIQMRLILPETPVWIKGHPDSLSQVLNNLIQNALQALEGREDGQITLTLEVKENEAWIAVQDNGPGIPPEVEARMFEYYFTTKRSGTGLGLPISKRLVEQMQGRIFAKTEQGQGTTFYVVFPAYMP